MNKQKINLVFFFFIFFLNLTLRFPYIHLHGGDGYVMIIRAVQIINEGHITWFIRFTSLFGWVPNSYPSGVPIIIATIDLVSSVSPLNFTLLISIILSFLGLSSCFILTRSLTNRYYAPHLSVLFLSLSNTFINYTNYNLSARSFFIVFILIAIFMIANSFRISSLRFTFLSLIILFILLTIHRVFYYFSVIFLIPLISYRIYSYSLKRYSTGNFYKKVFYTKTLLLLFFILINVMHIFQISPIDFGNYYILSNPESNLFNSSNGLFFLINLYALWVENFGIIILIAPLGFYYLFLRNNIDKLNYLFISMAISSIFFVEVAYFPVTFTGILVIISSIGFFEIKSIFGRVTEKVHTLLMVAVILSSIPLVFWYISKGYHISLAVSLISVLIVFFSLLNFLNSQNLNKLKVLFVTFFLVSVSFSIAITYYRSTSEYSEYEDMQKGPYVDELKFQNTATWFKHNEIDNVMFNNGSISNPIIANSGISTRAMGYNILTYEVYLEQSDLSLDFREFFKTGRVLFAEEETLDARYGPSSVTYEIMRGDIQLAKSYGVEYFLIPYDEHIPKTQDGVDLDLDYITLLESNSYSLYADQYLKLYNIYG